MAKKTDGYTRFVRSKPGGFIAKKVGLPRPTDLPRFEQRSEALLSPVLVLGDSAGADSIAETLVEWGGDVRRRADELDSVGSIVVVLDEIATPSDIGPLIRSFPGAFRKLARGGRVVTVSRPATHEDPAMNSARAGIEGFVRTLAKEARGGLTANGVIVADGVAVTAPAPLATLGFFLSAKSAFVTGQTLLVSADGEQLPADLLRPQAGRVALVTGAARGIGAAIARVMERDGATVIVVDIPAAGDALSKLANEIKAIPLQLDVTADNAGQRIVDLLHEKGLTLDVLVHNAGITRDKMFVNMTDDRWDSVVDVNIAAQLRINDVLLASDVISDSFRMVSLASTSGVAGNKGQSNYAVSKSGVMGMVAATAPILAERGGTANAVAPGFIETEMTGLIPPMQREIFRRSNSLSQGGQPIDVAETISFLSSAPAGGIHGQTLRVCGQNLVGR